MKWLVSILLVSLICSLCDDSSLLLLLFEGCGGPLLGASGVIRYPQEEGETYPHGRDCVWVISTNPDKVRPGGVYTWGSLYKKLSNHRLL